MQSISPLNAAHATKIITHWWEPAHPERWAASRKATHADEIIIPPRDLSIDQSIAVSLDTSTAW